MCGPQTDEDFLNAIVVRKRAVLSQGGQRLNAAARWCRPSSKPECVSLFPIRGLSLSSRHWQHREKRKNSPSGIHLPSLFCLGTLRPPSLPFIYTHIHTHTYSGTHAHIQTHTAVMTACRWTTWAHGQKWGHTEIKHIKRIPVSAHTRKRTTHTNTADTHLQMHDE